MGLAVMLLAAVAPAVAAGGPGRVPKFTDYRVRAAFHGKPAPVNLRSHPKARLFRGQLREGATKGPNFAGHYTVVTWGCGTECQTLAIVDAGTGRVYMAPDALRLGAEYRRDSSLLIANPAAAWREVHGKDLDAVDGGPPMSTYYQWDGRRLKRIAVVDVRTLKPSATTAPAGAAPAPGSGPKQE